MNKKNGNGRDLLERTSGLVSGHKKVYTSSIPQFYLYRNAASVLFGTPGRANLPTSWSPATLRSRCWTLVWRKTNISPTVLAEETLNALTQQVLRVAGIPTGSLR